MPFSKKIFLHTMLAIATFHGASTLVPCAAEKPKIGERVYKYEGMAGAQGPWISYVKGRISCSKYTQSGVIDCYRSGKLFEEGPEGAKNLDPAMFAILEKEYKEQLKAADQKTSYSAN